MEVQVHLLISLGGWNDVMYLSICNCIADSAVRHPGLCLRGSTSQEVAMHEQVGPVCSNSVQKTWHNHGLARISICYVFCQHSSTPGCTYIARSTNQTPYAADYGMRLLRCLLSQIIITNMNVAYPSTPSTLILLINSRLYACMASTKVSDPHRRPAVF